MIRRRLLLIGAAVIAAACVEDLTTPGVCPAYCPGNQLTIADTVLYDLSRDSSFRGYVLPHQSAVLLAANLPGVVDGRPIFRINGPGSRFRINPNDTTTGPILGSDSAKLQFVISRRDSTATNLTLRFYRLPKTIDSTTTFADVSGAFTDSLVRTLNIDTLLAKPNRKDSVTGDSAAVDTTGHLLTLFMKFDSTAARYIAADSGSVAYGIRISADSLASVTIAKTTLTSVLSGPLLTWYVQVDSSGVSVPRTLGTFQAAFASFVSSPPPPPIDSTLAVGGAPSARSIVRVAFPRVIRDSSQIIRATLILVPAVAARGAPIDSFAVEVHAVLVDLGAKSPIAVDVLHTNSTMIHIGATDTVRIEVTNVLQAWAADSTQPTTLVLKPKNEAQSFAEIRFYPTIAAAFRPSLQITFVRRYPFGGR
ncbi:MAG TPA: hypothetical protein VGV12_10570 [Gemmatimonadales bacterium]|nr:hypothetical protein [Gemmatimonadales bacterium]